MVLDESLRALLKLRLASFDAHRVSPGAHHAAAVAVVLLEEGSGAHLPGIPQPSAWSTDAALLLTRRAITMSRHAGQWALPGGRIDSGESAEAAALRELQEEVGLALQPDDVIGVLDDYVTRSGFVITPLVFWAGRAERLLPSADEVASVHRIPVNEFMRNDAPMLEPSDEAGRQILRMPVGTGWIAAPTAAVLYQFREVCIAGRQTRVAAFDQPLFARQ